MKPIYVRNAMPVNHTPKASWDFDLYTKHQKATSTVARFAGWDNLTGIYSNPKTIDGKIVCKQLTWIRY